MSRAVSYESFGGAEVLDLKDFQIHTPAREVRVRVAATGLNHGLGFSPRCPMSPTASGLSTPSGQARLPTPAADGGRLLTAVTVAGPGMYSRLLLSRVASGVMSPGGAAMI